MGFLVPLIVIWLVAMAAWFLVSKYFKSSDADKIKQRLTGIGKAPKQEDQRDQGRRAVHHPPSRAATNSPRCWSRSISWVPRCSCCWSRPACAGRPARLVHLSLVLFLAGFAVGWVMLPVGRPLAVVVGFAAGAGPFIYVWFKRQEPFEEIRSHISGNAGVHLALHARRPRVFRVARNDLSRVRRTRCRANSAAPSRNTTWDFPIEVALQKFAKRVPSLDVHFFVSAVLLQKRTGGNLAEILDKLAYVIRERFKLRGRIRAVSAHGRMTATALSLHPDRRGGSDVLHQSGLREVLFYRRRRQHHAGLRCLSADRGLRHHEKNREYRGLIPCRF